MKNNIILIKMLFSISYIHIIFLKTGYLCKKIRKMNGQISKIEFLKGFYNQIILVILHMRSYEQPNTKTIIFFKFGGIEHEF